MKNTKPYFAIFSIFLFLSCSADKPASNVADENKKAKNKETAIKNEATEITRAAQKLEQKGRAMEMFRQAKNAENMRECNIAMEDAQKQTKDLDDRIKKLPESFNIKLAPIIADLNECVSCSDKAKASCVNARASINKAIKEIFPQ